LNDVGHIEAELKKLDLKYLVMAGMAHSGRFAQIMPKVAYNGAIYVLVSRYDKFWPYFCLHYQF